MLATGTLAEIFGMDGVILLLVIVLVLFGGSQLPKLARGLGSAKSEFEKGMREGHTEPEADAADKKGTTEA